MNDFSSTLTQPGLLKTDYDGGRPRDQLSESSAMVAALRIRRKKLSDKLSPTKEELELSYEGDK